jgi:hypothetical protein
MVGERVAEDRRLKRRMTEMSDPSNPNIHVRVVRLFGWRAIVAAIAGLAALAAVIAFLTLSFLFIVVPTMAIGAVVYYLLPKRPSRTFENLTPSDRPGHQTIIDANYSITNDDAGKTGEAGNDHK